jgi:hypothetical protein
MRLVMTEDFGGGYISDGHIGDGYISGGYISGGWTIELVMTAWRPCRRWPTGDASTMVSALPSPMSGVGAILPEPTVRTSGPPQR